MILRNADSELFEGLALLMLREGLSVRFQARGGSMSPAIRDGEIVEVSAVKPSKLRKNDIILAKTKFGFRLHRIVTMDLANDIFVTRGDCGQENDPPLKGAQILGMARSKELRVGWMTVRASFRSGGFLRAAARTQYLTGKLFRKFTAVRFNPAARSQ